MYGWPDAGGNTASILAPVSVPAFTPQQRTATIRAQVTDQRLAPYLAEAFDDYDMAVGLYLWDRRLSSALFHDIAVIEVALRNAVDRALTDDYGPQWFTRRLFDDRTYTQIADAWARLPARHRALHADDRRTRGRLLASCMFGTWTSALDAGGVTGLPQPAHTIDHDIIWTRPALLRAFPGAAAIAGTQRAQLTRTWVHDHVRDVGLLRNRIAHHESLINGYPVPGTGSTTTPPTRHTIDHGLTACQTLAKMIDRDLATLIAQESTVTTVLAADPRHHQ